MRLSVAKKQAQDLRKKSEAETYNQVLLIAKKLDGFSCFLISFRDPQFSRYHSPPLLYALFCEKKKQQQIL